MYKIILCTTVGSYPSWAKWVIASCYNIVDHIICTNGGIDWDNIEHGKIVPLQREIKQLKQIDYKDKITQVIPNIKTLINKKLLIEGKDEFYRAGSMTYSYQYALNFAVKKQWDIDKVWIIKLDSDQILHHINLSREVLINLIENDNDVTGYRFGQFSDFHRTFDRCTNLCDWCVSEVGNMTNDGALFFKIHHNARAGGQGSPDIGQEYPYSDIKTFHMRRIHPNDVSEYDYHYYRFLYHAYGQNEIMESDYCKNTGKKRTLDELKYLAKSQTDGVLNSQGHTIDYFNNDERFPPGKPLVVELTPEEYIKQGYPNG